MKSMIKDINLAPAGHNKINWAKAHMPVMNLLEKEFTAKQPFKGLRVVICLHLEAKTAYMAQVIKSGGADVCVCASNPLSTQDDVVAALVDSGILAFAVHGASDELYHEHLENAIKFKPNLLIDDGGDVTALLHSKFKEYLPELIGGNEETTTGIVRLKALEANKVLEKPMIAVNDAYCKYLFDNRYGTGQSVWDGINRTTNLVIAGKTAVVAGYGWCGKGVAMRAKGLGAKVVVTEIDPIKAAEAWMDGFEVKTMTEAAKVGDVFVTVTGNKNVIDKEHLEVIKDGAILSNAGHFDIEVSKPALDELSTSKKTVRNNIEEYAFKDGRKVYLLGEGRLVNLACGDGHPAEIMDMTFALQSLSLEYLAENRSLPAKVYNVPEEIDRRVAELMLDSLGLKIDKLTAEQEEYLSSWQL
ncbi:MAG: adenosylhomocysteinase [Clostridia bacterium]|nr:adenosylhomocysteinase [Clostridia bacterium]